MRTTAVTNDEEYIDIRDVIARVEALERETEEEGYPGEAASLAALLEQCQGNGGDEEWRGHWYPLGLIRESYFEEYAQELAEDIGAIDRNPQWPLQYIDWDAACAALANDYMEVDFDGVTYLAR